MWPQGAKAFFFAFIRATVAVGTILIELQILESLRKTVMKFILKLLFTTSVV